MAHIATNFLYDVINEVMTYFEKSVDPFIIEQCKDIKKNVFDAIHITLRKRTKLLVKIATKIKNDVEKNPTCKKYINEIPIPAPVGYYYFFKYISSSDYKHTQELYERFPNDFRLAEKTINRNDIPLVYKIFIYANALIIDMPPSMKKYIKRDKELYDLKESDYIVKNNN